ncbi:MAG: gamma-butyrobetaine hydroxylase-like domain-containing protein [Hyphomicrobiales bacterium]
MSEEPIWPSEIRVSPDKRTLKLVFKENETVQFSAEFLRVHSPSAEVQGHSKEQKQTVPGKKNVEIMKVEPVGNYAVRINFDDMHNTGIFSWNYFGEMAKNKNELWEIYLSDLESKGMSRTA